MERTADATGGKCVNAQNGDCVNVRNGGSCEENSHGNLCLSAV